MHTATDVLVWGIIAHLVADWMLQTEWMVLHKTDLHHPAGWIHAGVHTLLMMLVFSWPLALLIGVTHLWIDTRIPLVWWMTVVKRAPINAASFIVQIWLDQVFHIAVLALVVLVFY
jgi:hypothetical protein